MTDDTAELYRAMKAEGQRLRGKNRERGAERLREAGIPFESRNGGAHLLINHNGCHVQYWPGTGLYIFNKPDTRRGRGIKALLKALNAPGV